eukprot:COSAG02_NODE_159_length_32891_cov_17.822518_8_plen_213_part_00
MKTGRWLAYRVEAAKHVGGATSNAAATGSGTIPARKILQLRSDGDESCWWHLCNITGVGVGGMLNYDGRSGVYLSPSAPSLAHSSSPRTIFIGPPSSTVSPPDGELQLCVTMIPSADSAVVAEAAADAGASGWELRPCSQGSPVLAGESEDTSTGDSMDTPVPEFPAELRKERVLEYDAIRYPFREMLAKILESDNVVSSSQARGKCTNVCP